MEPKSRLAQTLILCGTLINLAAIVLVMHATYLSAQDLREHRQEAATLLREARVDRVDLPSWEEPTSKLIWFISVGGFLMIGLGVLLGVSSRNVETKPRLVPDWAERSVV